MGKAAASSEKTRGERGRTAVAVDEYSLWLETLVRIADSAGVRVVGSSTRSQEGIRLLESERPEIFLLGLDRSGVDRGTADSLLSAASAVDRTRVLGPGASGSHCSCQVPS